MIPVIEMFASIQGEGLYAGVPTIFIRFSGCNLRCIFKGSICDTPYSSFHPEKGLYNNMDEFVNEFFKLSEQYPAINQICLTGGEPLLHKDIISKFLSEIRKKSEHIWTITVETNGTIPVFDKNIIDLYSVSPKLSSSVGDINNLPKGVTKEMIEQHDKIRINIDNLYNIVQEQGVCMCQLKFVYSGKQSIEDILNLRRQLIEKHEIMVSKETPAEHLQYELRNFADELDDMIMLMPEGVTNEQLQKTRKECIAECMKYGWQYTDRLQIVVWGDKRGV